MHIAVSTYLLLLLSLLHLHLILYYFIPLPSSPNTTAADITRYLTHHSPPAYDNFILAPKLINPASDKAVEVEEFKLYGTNLIDSHELRRQSMQLRIHDHMKPRHGGINSSVATGSCRCARTGNCVSLDVTIQNHIKPFEVQQLRRHPYLSQSPFTFHNNSNLQNIPT